MSSGDSSVESEMNIISRKRGRNSHKCHRASAKRRKDDNEFSAYEKFARWQARTGNPFIDYFTVLDIGMRWEKRSYGNLSFADFREKYTKEIEHYTNLRDSIADFEHDYPGLATSSRAVNKLAKVMHIAAAAARGDDIASLNNHGLKYIALEQPGKQLVPDIAPDADKTASRGHNHPALSRLLCPARLLQEFDADPTEYMRKLKRSEIKVRAFDFASFLYPKDGYDPDDVEANLLRNPIAVRFFRSIFTSPGSAVLENGGKTKAKSCQAKLNGMTEVTPGSIAYTYVLLRHFLTGIKDWRVEDDLFNREDFHSIICSLFKDDDSEWVKDTLDWWNMQIFGSLPKNLDEDMLEPNFSTLDILRAQRAQKAAIRHQVEGASRSPVPEPESDTESDSEPENEAAEPPPPHALPPSNLLEDLELGLENLPPGLRRKDIARNQPHAGTAQHNSPVRLVNPQRSTPPVASSSTAGHALLSGPPQGHLSESQASQRPRARQTQSLSELPQGHLSQASQRPSSRQTQSSQKQCSSRVGKSHRPRKN